MNDFFIPFGRIFSLLRSKVSGLYNFGFDVIQGSTTFNSYGKDQEKLAMVLSNPAVLKVFALQCDLFSMGKVTVTDKEGKEIEDDPFLTLIQKPNPFSNQSQFLFDYMFYLMLGTAYAYVDSKVVDRKGNKVYYLDPSKIEWPHELEKKKDKMIFSDAEFNSIMKTEITYRYSDGTAFKFPFDRMVMSFDLTNGIGNFFKGVSRVDALYKIISNSEHVLDSENINIRYTGKFLVGADQSTGANSRRGMAEDEKKDIELKVDSGDKKVWAINSKLDIKRFVTDLAALQLPQEYLHQYFLIGNMYNIPRDVLEAYNSATYENQEKARAAHANYTLDPKGNQFMDAFENHFDYRINGKNIKISWEHLPFMQVFANEKVNTKKTTVEVLNSLLALGIPIEDANKFLGTEFKIPPPKTIAEDNSSPETLAAQAGLRGSVGGVQGILAVQASVAAGTTDYNAAISILTVIYGFTEQQAIDLLGKPDEQGQTESGQGGATAEEIGEGESAEEQADNQKIRLLK